MILPKKYVHDRVILLLLSVNLFLALLTIILLALRIGDSSGSYIVEYRQNLGVNAFKAGGGSQLISFGLYAAVIVAINFILSARTYRIHRQLSVVILGVGALLLLFGIIVSNALLVLR